MLYREYTFFSANLDTQTPTHTNICINATKCNMALHDSALNGKRASICAPIVETFALILCVVNPRKKIHYILSHLYSRIQ